jgi:ribose transport system ATP-binding protein
MTRSQVKMARRQVDKGQEARTAIAVHGTQLREREGPARLVMTGITKRFGGTVALRDVDFEVRAGEIHGLVGQNGAGKSTLMKIVAGEYRPDFGQILLDGRAVEVRDPRHGLALGIGVVYQELSLLPNLTVAENVALGREQSRLGVVSRTAVREQAEYALASLGINNISIDARVSKLSVAEQQLVEIARVLSRDVRILVLDEPTAALSLHDTRRLFRALRHLVNTGVGVVFVSHRYGEVLEICDRCTVLRNGEVVAREEVASLTLEKLVELTLGGHAKHPYVVQRLGPASGSIQTVGGPLLSVEHLSVGKTVVDVSFEVWAGEIVGLCGLVGSGQSEVARALCGDAQHVGGKVLVAGRVARLANPRQAIGRGIGFITENRRDEGIFPDLSVVPNVTAACLRQSWVSKYVPVVSLKREKSISWRVLDGLSMPGAVAAKKARMLSGGNQQKVVVGRWLLKDPRLLVCSEPTRGVDVGARADIYRALRALAQRGAGVLVVSADIDEVLSVCDRIVVCLAGRVSGDMKSADACEESLFRAIQGLSPEAQTDG